MCKRKKTMKETRRKFATGGIRFLEGYMKKFLRKISYGAAALLFACNFSASVMSKTFASAENGAPAQTESSEKTQESSDKYFYEADLERGVFSMENVSNEATLAVYDLSGGLVDDSIVYTMNENEINFSGLDSEELELGNEYILRILSSGDILEIPFMYVTRALRSVEDLSVLNIDTADEIITGYYVLANDIDAGYQNRVLEHDGYNGSASTCGFAGTFDGLGHSLTFLVGSSGSSKRYGLFGFLRAGAIIKNTAFVDIMTNSSAILAKSSNAYFGKQVYITDCFFSIVNGHICGGAILENGQVWINLENIVIDWEGVEFDVQTTGTIYAGAIFGKYLNRGNEHSDSMMNNVYVISKAPLAFYHAVNYDGPMHSANFYAFYAGNDNVAYDMTNGVYKFSRVKRYPTGAEMAKAKDSYSNFDGKYWDFTAGFPIFKSAIDSAGGIAIDGERITRKVLYTGFDEGDYTRSVHIAPSLLGAPIENVEMNYEITEGANCITIDKDGVVTAVTAGKAKINVSYTYNNVLYEETLTITVKEIKLPASPSSSSSSVNENDGESEGSGCASNVLMSGSVTSLLLLLGIATLFLKRKVNK